MNIAILGAGNGGVTMAAHLTLLGHQVSLYDKYEEAVSAYASTKQIQLEGVLGTHTVRLAKVTTRLQEAVESVEMIMIVTPAFAHRELAEQLSSLLDPKVPVVLHPGRTGGAMEFRYVVSTQRNQPYPPVAETQTLLYACRKTGTSSVTVYGIKHKVAFAVLPAEETDRVGRVLCGLFPQFKAVSNVLETSLLNIGAIFHPAPTVLNAGWIETTKGNFQHYREGISPSIARVLESLDAERIRVAEKLGVTTKSATSWLKDVYGVEGQDLYTAIQGNEVYRGIIAPPSLDTRYLSEDVPMSLVPLTELARLTGVKTPTMDSVIHLASVLHGKDYRKGGRTLERMGLAGMSVDQVKQFVQNGGTK